MSNKFYITMALPYASQKPHVGNSFEGVLTDSIARYKKLAGKEVFFLTGMDSHGQKIEQEAKEAGINPLEYTKVITDYTISVWEDLNVKYDKIINTTDEYHEKAIQEIFMYLYDKGDIYKGEYSGWYCVPDESFYTESQVEDGKCPDCGREVEKVNEESYFLKLSKYQKQIEEFYENNPGFITPTSRKNEILNNFIKPGLQDLSITRTSFKWGVKVPFDKKHVIYVWIDALPNYITALGYTPDNKNSELYKKYWPADLHVIGKEINRFHAIYWPIMLMALGEKLPKQLLVHPWIVISSDNEAGHKSEKGVKMSKSLGNVLYAKDFVKYFGTDATRYYLLSAMSFSSDSAISFKDMIIKYNSDLANTLGNLVNRTITMQQKYFSSVVQKKVDINNEFDNTLYETKEKSVANYIDAMDAYRLSDALKYVMDLARACNKYIDETMPWVLAKDEKDKQRLGSVLHNLLDNIRVLAILLKPIIPDTVSEIFNQINVLENTQSLDTINDENAVVEGTIVKDPVPIFARIDEAKKLKEIALHQDTLVDLSDTKDDDTVDNLITFDDFTKVKLIAAEIIEVSSIEGADKLLTLQLDDGSENTRQVVSGIAQNYKKEDLIGKKIALVSNLKPVTLRGVVSNGMILAATKSKNDISVVFLDKSVPNGAEIN